MILGIIVFGSMIIIIAKVIIVLCNKHVDNNNTQPREGIANVGHHWIK